MQPAELLELIDKGEDSRTQFKKDVTNAVQLAQEMVAFSNSKGGFIIVGVDDAGNIKGLDSSDIRRLNQLISNSANENVKPPITPFSEIIKVGDKKVLVIEIKEGVNKPYCTAEGIYFAKVGSDKRKISQEELLRLFQESSKLYADEMIIHDSSANDIDKELFYTFYEKLYGENIEASGMPLDKILENLNLARENKLNLAGLLLFGKNPQRYEPVFLIKAVSFFGNEMGGTQYRDSEDIDGNLSKQYRNGMAFLLRNLKKIQKGKNFNTPGVLEVSEIALQEILVNALIHRDYFIGAPIRILIFDNRIEIDNPGKLPNNLTLENIKSGISCIRNRIIASYAFKMLPYRGLGSGIIRALKDDPNIEFINDISAERFKVIIRRPV
jgi:ATP-dependent DNA helicase RecG